MRYTNKLKVLEILIAEKDWLPVYNFQDRHGIFVGHRAPARISELAKEYPTMVEERKIEDKRSYEYRFRKENIEYLFNTLPEELKKFVRSLLEKYHYTFTVEKLVPEFNRGQNKVILVKKTITINP